MKKEDQGRVQEALEEDDIVAICMESNRDKYTQAFETELMKDEWRQKLGEYLETEFTGKILEGRVSEEEMGNITEGAKMLIRELAAPKDMKPIYENITPEANAKVWRRMDKMTSLLPSGLHIGL